MGQQILKWQLWFVDDGEKSYFQCKTLRELKRKKYKHFNVEIPCDFENELQKNGYLEDLYYSDNVFKAQKYEYYHQWYVAEFDKTIDMSEIIFNGIDTIADIYLNGKYLGHTENKFLQYRFPINGLQKKKNELVVHIYPVLKETADQDIGMGNYSFDYNYSSLSVRKSPCSYGWDIFPRILGGGIWKSVDIVPKEDVSIEESYLYTRRIIDNVAELGFYYSVKANINIQDFEIEIDGYCNNSHLYLRKKMWHNKGNIYFDFNNPELWWPIYAGAQNLYDVNIKVYHCSKVVAEKRFSFGIRTIKLDRTIYAEPDGKFEFIVNGKKIFILGTNWVPLDCFHTKSPSKMEKALSLIKDLGCNMVRVWGGGYYESEEFYNYCDKNGILIWQDFMMACAVYPQNKDFLNKIETEAVYVVKNLRQHPAIALWSGDNECDCAYNWTCVPRNPTNDRITRGILPKVIEIHDYVRQFLCSSPCMDGDSYLTWNMSEWHQWAQGEFFKSGSYKNLNNEFISETGYLALPSEKSLRDFLREPDKIMLNEKEYTPEYLAHLCSMASGNDEKYVFRLKFVIQHTKDLFGYIPDNLTDLVQMTQISQAEALKFFIERMRIKRQKDGGIIIWNLLDGYTQISDAIVDYYFRKKLAYYYIKRSQQRLCLMFDEPCPDLALYAVNDNFSDEEIEYTVTNLEKNEVVLSGKATVKKESSEKIATIVENDLEKSMYLIEWTTQDGNKYKNHYFAKMPNIDYETYLNDIKSAGFEHFE
ncbi:MAG: hypothetical protein IJQ07_02870 [Clostridia bacterium]|nr:hypothetical protein [Clostridia bacterium]